MKKQISIIVMLALVICAIFGSVEVEHVKAATEIEMTDFTVDGGFGYARIDNNYQKLGPVDDDGNCGFEYFGKFYMYTDATDSFSEITEEQYEDWFDKCIEGKDTEKETPTPSPTTTPIPEEPDKDDGDYDGDGIPDASPTAEPTAKPTATAKPSTAPGPIATKNPNLDYYPDSSKNPETSKVPGINTTKVVSESSTYFGFVSMTDTDDVYKQKKTVDVKGGGKHKLYMYLAEYVAYRDVIIFSKDKSIANAYVDPTYSVVTVKGGSKQGTTKIYFYLNSVDFLVGVLTVSTEGKVKKPAEKVKIVKESSLGKSTLKLTVDSAEKGKAVPSDAKLKWSTGNKKVAAISGSSKSKILKLTAKKKGKATITVRFSSKKSGADDFKATYTVKVNASKRFSSK